MLEHYFADKVILNENILSLKRGENRNYKFYILDDSNLTILEMISEIRKKDSIYNKNLNYLRALTYEAEDDVETLIYDGFNEDKITVEEIMKKLEK